jgi:hypothetical protein
MTNGGEIPERSSFRMRRLSRRIVFSGYGGRSITARNFHPCHCRERTRNNGFTGPVLRLPRYASHACRKLSSAGINRHGVKNERV